VGIGEVAEPHPPGFSDTIQSDVPDTRERLGDLITSGTAVPSALTESEGDVLGFGQAQRDPGREQVPDGDDPLAGILHRPHHGDPDRPTLGGVSRRPLDCAKLIQVDETVNRLVTGKLSRDEARDEVTRIVSTGHVRHRWTVTLGWGAMGTGIALTLGGDLVVCMLAFLAACAIDGAQLLLPEQRIPSFYQQAAGGFVATLIAVIASATELEVNPSRVVTTGIVMLLAGVGIPGATQDALTGFPVTASARLVDAMLNTAGIIAGVGAGLTVGDLLGVGLTTFKPGAAGLAAASVTVVGAAFAAAGFRSLPTRPRAP
jgi:uncharacterized membrane protein YjjP (DUF1212 family)